MCSRGPSEARRSRTTIRRGSAGAQATAAAIYYARRTRDKDEIRRLLESLFGYDLSTSLDQIRPSYRFDETRQGTVPPALRA